MNFNITIFALFATWVAQLLYFSAILPQIRLNFKRKTTKGLSKSLLFAYANGYFFFLCYVFCLNLPISYRILVPITFLASLFLLFQYFYYANFKDKKVKRLFIIFLINLFCQLLFVLFLLQKNPLFWGNLFGWFTIIIFAFCYFPQIIKIIQKKSTKGFSFALITLFTLGDIVELISALILKLPMQTIFSNIRSIIIYLVFCGLFILYNKKMQFINLKIKYIKDSLNDDFLLFRTTNLKFIKKKLKEY